MTTIRNDKPSYKDKYDGLNQRAYTRMMKVFAEREHYPSPAQLKGLGDIQEVMTMMLADKAEPKLYLSSLDPGCGKSTAIATWIETYIQLPFLFNYEGIIIGVDRLEEIYRFVADCKLPEHIYGVLVEEGRTIEVEEDGITKVIELDQAGVGREHITNAIILFTTKEQIKRRKRGGRTFDEISEFHYQGKVRKVRIWDETWSIGAPITLNPDDFGKTLSGFGEYDKSSKRIILSIINDILECKAGDKFQFPEFPVSIQATLHAIPWKTEEEKELAELLVNLSGELVSIREYQGNNIVVDCIQDIPDGFLPCLVTDASGRVKGSYQTQNIYLHNVSFMTTEDQYKSYRNLEVKVWRRSTSKIALLNDRDKIAEEVSKVVLDRPIEEPFLIICYKSQDKLMESILNHLPENHRSRIHFLTWGRVTAVNHYKDIPNTIITSPYFYRNYSYEANTMAAGLRTTSKGGVTQEEISTNRRGEIYHHLLQALRGSARKSVGDTCPVSRLWMILSPNTGIEKDLTTIIYPECSVTAWEVTHVKPKKLTAKQEMVLKLIVDEMNKGQEEFPAAPIRNALGMQFTPFNKMIMGDTFQEALKSIRLSTISKSSRMYFQVVT